MAEDQTQQTRVLLVDGQTYILQGDAGDNSINEINEDVLQQALQQATANASNETDQAEEYITSDGQILQTEDNQNFVAIFQGEQGEHTIQLTVEQAEALGLHFSTDNEVKEESQNGATHSLCLPDGATAQLVYATSEDAEGEGAQLMFQSDETPSESITGNTNIVHGAQLVDSESGEIFEAAAEGIDYSAVSAFIADNPNQNISLVPQIINGQVTYTLKIQDEEEDDNGEKLLIQDGNQFAGLVPVQAVTDDLAASLSQTSTDPSSISSETTATTGSFKAVQEVMEGETDILTDNKASNVSFVIVPSDESNDSLLLSKSLQSGNIVESLQSISNGKDISTSLSEQLTSVSEGYSTITTVDTSGSSILSNTVSLTSTGCLTGIPIASAIQSTSSVGLLSTGSGNGVVRVLSSDHSTLTSSAGTVTKFTSILSPSNRLTSSSTKPTPISRLVPLTGSTPKMVSINPLTSKVISVNPKPAAKSIINTTTSKFPSNLTVQPKLSLNTSTLASKLLAPVTAPAPKLLAPVASRSTDSNVTKTSLASSNTLPKFITANSILAKANTSVVPPTSTSKLITVSSAPSRLLNITTTSDTKTPASISNAVSAALNKGPSSKTNTSKPLGSSENPIQLVQHGQTFHSMQTLSQSQLRQIATVLKQQNLDTTPRTKNVLYDPETKTRIIYRVVYPEDLDLQDPKSPDNRGYPMSRGRGRRGRPPKNSQRSVSGRSSVDLDLDEDRLLDDPSKNEKKKHLPRTRSGRLSRPPRHMVKDYKRLHHLDFADADLDDSDGGYSDYQISDVEAEEQQVEKEERKELFTAGLVPVQKRKISSHFRCPKCQKIYLGHRRMARHFEVYPDHGSIDQFEPPTAPKKETTEERIGTNGLIRSGPGRKRGRKRGWSNLTPEARSQRRRLKLQEALTNCEPSEIADLCGSSVAGVLSLWELLLLRIDSVQTGESYVATLCDELLALLEKVRSVSGSILHPLPIEEKEKNDENHIELQDEFLCNALGLPSGLYKADDHALRNKKRSLPFHEESAAKRFKGGDDEDDEEEEYEDAGEEHMDDSSEKIVGGKGSECPELLTALTLVANVSNNKSLNSSTSSSKVHFVDESSIGLSEDSNDITSIRSRTRLDSTTEQQSKDSLQTVDEIVNESLKNMNFSHSGIVSSHLSREMANSKDNVGNEFSMLHQSGDDVSVSSFDPEIALATMGEGSQQADRQTERHFKLINTSDELDTSFDADEALADLDKTQLVAHQEPKRHESFVSFDVISGSSDVMNSIATKLAQKLISVRNENNELKNALGIDNTHSPPSFDPGINSTRSPASFVPTINNSCSSASFNATINDNNHSPASFDPAISNSHSPASFDPAINNSSQSPSFDPAINNSRSPASFDPVVNNNHSPASYNPDAALAEGDQENNSSHFDHRNKDTQMDVDLSDRIDSTKDTSNDKNDIMNTNLSQVHYSFMQSDFNAETALTLKEGQSQGTNKGMVIVDTSNFTPEMALAAMGEGEETSEENSNPAVNVTQSGENSSTFDPETALTAMEDDDQEEESRDYDASRQAYQIQCASDQDFMSTRTADLVFEALEDFSENVQHS